jgi:amidophosphoribosyltransferase
MLIVDKDGMRSRKFGVAARRAECIFEHVYFARPDSRAFGRGVNEIRVELGRQLAREHPATADVVMSVPDSSNAAALGYSRETGIPLEHGLIRNHYVGRTFISPTQPLRNLNVRLKFNAVREALEGKRVVVVDDSIVRGTTMRKIVRMVRGAGALAVHVRVSCPPIISPCFYGIDTPTRRELIGSHKKIDEIGQFIEADSLGYLSLDGMRKAVADAEGRFCLACYTGNYPTDFVELKLQQEAAAPAAADDEAFHGKRGLMD